MAKVNDKTVYYDSPEENIVYGKYKELGYKGSPDKSLAKDIEGEVAADPKIFSFSNKTPDELLQEANKIKRLLSLKAIPKRPTVKSNMNSIRAFTRAMDESRYGKLLYKNIL